jgi:hypothetical protein
MEVNMEGHFILRSHRSLLRGLLVGCIVVLFVMILSSSALAQSPDPTYVGPDQCASCHPTEAREWQGSTHAKATSAVPPEADRACLRCHTTAYDAAEGTCAYNDVICEACHGAYVEGHPRSATMKLTVDSSTCQECHAKTFEEWETTSHAQLNVQCIGCHDAHSQQLRLANDTLCTSCHRAKLEDFPHSEHQGLAIECTVCHVPASHTADLDVTQVSNKGGGSLTPNHNFEPPAETCVGCHAQGTIATQSAGETLDAAEVLADQLAASERANGTLRNLAIVTLGLGLGIGGVLGVILVLCIGYVSQRRGKPWTI